MMRRKPVVRHQQRLRKKRKRKKRRRKRRRKRKRRRRRKKKSKGNKSKQTNEMLPFLLCRKYISAYGLVWLFLQIKESLKCLLDDLYSKSA